MWISIFQLLMSGVITLRKKIFVLLLLLKRSLTLAFTSPFSCPHLPYLDYAAGWLSQLFCMQVALAWFFVEERESVLRMLRMNYMNYSFSWRRGVEKTRLPCLINCHLRETDISGGGQWFWKSDQPFRNGNGSTHYCLPNFAIVDDVNWSFKNCLLPS